jgi:hypothetical protein
MVDQATSKYLHDNIGDVLAKALSDMAVQQPNDGVDFLAQWLKTYVEQEELKTLRGKEEKQVNEDRKTIEKKEQEKAVRIAQKTAQVTATKDAFKSLQDTFNDKDTMFKDGFWAELLNVVKQTMGAQSVYLGIFDDEGNSTVEEAPHIRYLYENICAGSPTLLDKTLPKTHVSGEVDNITHNALMEIPAEITDEDLKLKCLWKPPLPPPPPVDPQNPDAEVPQPQLPKYLPVTVPCVTDVPLMHFYEMPRLGAYLVFPIVYSSYYSPAAVGEAKKFEEEKMEALRIKMEAQKQKEEQIKEAEEKGEPIPEFPEEAEEPEKVMELSASTTKMVLCLDTLGTNTLFDESKFASMTALVDACAACKSRTEMKEIAEQAKYAISQQQSPDQQDDPAAGGIAQMRANAEAELAKALDEEKKVIADSGSEQRTVLEDIVDKKYLYLKNKMVVNNLVDSILAYVNVSFAVPPEVLTAFAAIAFLIGYTKEDVYPPRKKDLKWLRMKSLFEGTKSEVFFTKLQDCNLEVGRKNLTAEQKLSSIKSLMSTIPADFTSEKAAEVDPTFEALWVFLSSAIDYRTSELNQKQEEYSQRKKAAEAEEQTFEEPDLSTVDDDFEVASPPA